MMIDRPKVFCSTLREVRLCSKSRRTTSAVPAERNATAVVTLAPCSKAMRAATWLLPKIVAIASSRPTPAQRGIGCSLRSASVRLDAVVAHDLAPERELLERPLLQRLGAAHHEVHAQRLGQRLAHIRLV